MENLCLLTGVNKNDTPIKKMCINCVFSQKTDSNYICNNTNVIESGHEKIKEAAKNFGFDIDTLTLKPMELKNPSKKCQYYKVNIDMITSYINDLFNEDN